MVAPQATLLQPPTIRPPTPRQAGAAEDDHSATTDLTGPGAERRHEGNREERAEHQAEPEAPEGEDLDQRPESEPVHRRSHHGDQEHQVDPVHSHVEGNPRPPGDLSPDELQRFCKLEPRARAVGDPWIVGMKRTAAHPGRLLSLASARPGGFPGSPRLAVGAPPGGALRRHRPPPPVTATGAPAPGPHEQRRPGSHAATADRLLGRGLRRRVARRVVATADGGATWRVETRRRVTVWPRSPAVDAKLTASPSGRRFGGRGDHDHQRRCELDVAQAPPGGAGHGGACTAKLRCIALATDGMT